MLMTTCIFYSTFVWYIHYMYNNYVTHFFKIHFVNTETKKTNIIVINKYSNINSNLVFFIHEYLFILYIILLIQRILIQLKSFNLNLN